MAAPARVKALDYSGQQKLGQPLAFLSYVALVIEALFLITGAGLRVTPRAGGHGGAGAVVQGEWGAAAGEEAFRRHLGGDGGAGLVDELEVAEPGRRRGG